MTKQSDTPSSDTPKTDAAIIVVADRYGGNRDVYVRKFINVTATEQRGRRRRARMGEESAR